MESNSGFLLANRKRVEQLIDRVADRIIADAGSAPYLVGIRRRGVPLMNRVRERMESRTGDVVSSGELALKRYADDLSVLHEQPELKSEPDLDVEGAPVVLIDDVLYSGRTMWRAINVVQEAGADRVRTAVLCSRGDNDVPVSASFVGLQLDVCEHNVIEVHVPPYEEDTGIWLFHRKDLAEEE